MRIDKLRKDAATAAAKKMVVLPLLLDLTVLEHEALVYLWQVLDGMSHEHHGLRSKHLADYFCPDVRAHVRVDS